MTTKVFPGIKDKKIKTDKAKPLLPSPPSSNSDNKMQEPKLVGLAALLDEPAPGLFKSVVEVDAHIRDGRGDWDDED